MRNTAALGALGFFAFAVAQGAAADVGSVASALPTAKEIRAHVLSANGTEPNAFRETLTQTYDDGTMTVTHYVKRGADWRQAFDTGPLHREMGSYGGKAWYQNYNGQVVPRASAPPDPDDVDPIATTVSAIPIGYRISELTLQHTGTITDVDSATWRVVRIEEVGATGSVITVYSNFANEAGSIVSHRQHIVDDDERRSSDVVRSFDVLPTAAGDVSTPAARRRLIEFPDHRGPIDIPARFVGHEVIVHLTIAERGLDFVLDTGASSIVLDTSVAKELGLPIYDRRSTFTAGRHEVGYTVVPEMRIGNLVMREVATAVLPHGWKAAAGVKDVGLLGFDFISELGLTIDYAHQRVTAVPAEEYRAPSDSDVAALDVRLGSGQPEISAALNGQHGEHWILDSGGTGGIMVFDGFARRHPAAVRDRYFGESVRPEQSYRGIGGGFTTVPFQIGRVDLAETIHLKNVEARRITSAASYAGSIDGIVGNDVLALFTVGLDYQHQRVYLDPNPGTRSLLQSVGH